MKDNKDIFKLGLEEIRIVRFPNGQSMIKTQIGDARKVLSILAITVGGFVKEIQSQNKGREMEILNSVLNTIRDVSNDNTTTIKPITNSEIQ